MTTTHPAALRLRALVSVLLVVAAVLVLAACGSDSDDGGSTSTAGGSSTSGGASTASSGSAIQKNAANAKVKLTIGSKNFTEQKVLGEVYAQALQAAGYSIKKELNLGDENTALKTLKSGQISAYPEYTGTALLSFFDVKTDALPSDSTKAFDLVRSDFAKEGIDALPPTPFTNSNEVAVTEATAKRYGLRNISDLSKVNGKLKLYGSPECRQRRDCLLGLQQTYGLKFKSFTPVDVSQRSTVLKGGQADISIVFTTDPQNARDKFVLLKDDKGIFPPYNSTLLVKKSTAEKAGADLTKTIEAVNKNLTAQNIQELGARVDLDKETPADAAAQFLKSFGYVAKSR